MPLDIFVPFWGDADLLRRTVDSVLAQESDDWLLTVVDDAYPDPAAAAWIADIDDERVRLVRNQTNAGITENYDRCRAMSTEDLLVFLGCDDVLHPNYVATVLDAHRAHPTAAIIQPGVQIIDENDVVIDPLADRIKRRIMPRERVVLGGEALAVSLLRGNWLYWPSLVFQRDRVKDVPFRPGLPIVQDLALIVDMAHAGDQLLYEPTLCFSYRRHTSSASAASMLSGSRFADDRRYFAMAADQARTRGWRRAERTAKLRLTSRAHALSLVPGALARGKVGSIGPLLNHAFHP